MRKGLRKSMAFTLVLAMLLASVGFGAGFAGMNPENMAFGAEPGEVAASVRIEGYDSTFLAPTTVTLPAGATAWDAVASVASDAGIEIFTWGGYISSITKGAVTWSGSDPSFAPADSSAYNMSGWVYRINGVSENQTLEQITIEDGDQITLAYGAYGDYGYFENPEYFGVVGYPLTMKLNQDNWTNPGPVEGASIYDYQDNGSPKTVLGTTASDGTASITFDAPGVYELTAEHFISGYLTAGDINTITRPYTRITVISSAEMDQKIDADAAELSISYDGTASTITLPTLGTNGASISWASSNPDLISSNGTVTRPVCGAGDQSTTLSATVGDLRYSVTRDFPITVNEYTEAEVLAALDSMSSWEIPPASILSNIVYLATVSSDRQIRFVWTSSNPEVIGETQGTCGDVAVTQPSSGEEAAPVTLTATAISGNVTKTRSFSVLVQPIDDAAKITEMNQLINGIAADVQENDRITGHMIYGSEWVQAMVSSGNAAKISSEDQSNYLAMALDEARSDATNIGKIGKLVTGLTALGIDPRAIPGENEGEVINLVEKLYVNGPTLNFGGQYNIPYVMMGYNLDYTLEGIDRNQIIQQAINKMYEIEGGTIENTTFYNAWSADSIGMFSAVLSPYYATNTTAQGIVDRGITWLKANHVSGTFGNANSDAMVVLGLSSLMDNADVQSSSENFLHQIGEGLMSYKTSDDKGFVYGTSYNLLATVQGFQAITAYETFLEDSASDLYIFDYPTTGLKTEVDWPTEKQPIDISVAPPSQTTFPIDSWIDASTLDFVVTATYLDNSTEVIPNSLCTVSYLDTSTAGAKQVSVSYLGKTKTFTVVVESASSPVTPKEVQVTIKGTSVSGAKVIINNNSSVLSVLEEICAVKGIDLISYKGYVSSMDGKAEFDDGPNSGWLYQVNGNTPSTTGADQYKLSGGENISWYYTTDFTKDSSSSAWVTVNQPVAGAGDAVNINTDAEANMNNGGAAKVIIATRQMADAVSEALEVAGTRDVMKEITIQVSMNDNAVSLETEIAKDALTNMVNSDMDRLTIQSALGSVSLDSDSIKEILKKTTGSVSITLKKAGDIQGRPLVGLEMVSNGIIISQFAGLVTVSLPYELAPGEKVSGVIVFYVDEEGIWKNVKNSIYTEESEMVTFYTDHFSSFVIGYKQVSFPDVNGHWAQESIEFLANRGIIKGMTSTTFVPNGRITRAEFVTLLAGLSGADMESDSLSQFSDVSQNAWFAEAVAWAVEQGITQGNNMDGENKTFGPNQNITRQDMAVMMDRYLKNDSGLNLSSVAAKMDFADAASMSGYAKPAITVLQQAGLINGKSVLDGKTYFEPFGYLTRAEAAKIMAGIVKSYQ